MRIPKNFQKFEVGTLLYRLTKYINPYFLNIETVTVPYFNCGNSDTTYTSRRNNGGGDFICNYLPEEICSKMVIYPNRDYRHITKLVSCISQLKTWKELVYVLGENI